VPRQPTRTTDAYHLYGPEMPASPVILSIPHAGRDYPAALIAQARVREEALRRLEDRGADLIAHPLIAAGYTVIIARAPRAMIDLNRDEREIDQAMVEGMPRDQPLQSSAKLRGGLGLIPRRLQGVGDLWSGLLPWAEVRARIDRYHRPYQAAIEALMDRARQAYGHAILIDLHSMPPLPSPMGAERAAQLVIGDRFGRSAGGPLARLVADIAEGRGIVTAQNHPYAGDHLIERHGRPARGLHAIQLEIDRCLYLDALHEQPGMGLPMMQALVVDIVNALAQELPREGYAMAAE
jgi:N-formylglutamate amidohydrolase